MSSDRKLLHINERLGHVAVDMGLMTKEQVREAQLQVVVSNAGEGGSMTFAQTAVEMGFLRPADVAALETEERRRRRLISGYEIIDMIGSGTIATVYHARQLAMDRDVALKILHPRLASDPVFVRAYLAEAQAVSRFHHPNIVQGFDAGESNGFYYFAHEYMPGGSMFLLLAQGKADFSEKRLLMYLRQTTAALKHAWAVAVYHGDINPGNLLLDAGGNIKLANLGVPRVAGMENSGPGNMTPGFVRCGPEYAAPEQLERPEVVNALTDMYNLGATFYHISFGQPPFPGRNREEVLAFRHDNPAPSFSLKNQERFSGKYLRLLHDMLETDPAKRPSNPEELADRLEMFHQADAGKREGLVRPVRAGARIHPVAPPCPNGSERAFSLAAREESPLSRRAGRWALTALLAALAALALGRFLL